MLLLANLALSEASERTLGDGAIFKAGMLAMTGDGAGAKEILHNKKNEMKEEYEDYKAYQKFKEERHEQQEYRYGGGGGSGGGGGGGGYRQQGGYQHYGYGERPGYRGNGGQQWGNGGRYRSMPMEKAEAAPAADGAKPRGGWMPFAQQGAATGAGFGAQGMDTAFRFFTDPNFDFQKEGQAYQASGAATGNAFGGLSQGMLPQQQAAAAVASPEAAAAPAEKVGWQSFAQQGASTGGGFMQQGAGTASAFMTDPNFDFAKEGDKYKASGAQTQSAFGALGREKSAEAAPAADGAKPRGGWMPFAQQGAATGAGFGAQGMDTAFRFFTDPNFDFQKEGQAYQASGAATGNAFGGLSQGMLPQQQQAAAAVPEKAPAAAAPAEKVGWMPYVQAGAETGVSYAAQGASTGFRFFTDPNFDFQKEGEAYQESGKATQDKFGAIGQEEAGEGEAVEEAAADEAAPAALRAAPRPTAKQGYSFGAIGLVALFAVGAAVVGAIRARARSGPQYVRQTNPDELV